MPINRRCLFAAPLLAASLLLRPSTAAPATADPIADFYRGKNVSFVVGSSTGGGYDTIARLIARFLGKHTPGNPTFVVRNMPGAGSITALNYVYNTADKDGSVMAMVQNNAPLEPLFGTKEARYDATRLNWLGTPSFEVAMVLLWHAVPVNSLTDLQAKETSIGASGANSTPAFYARLLNATLGTKMKIINGYPGQNDAFLAMERGELDGYPSVFVNSLNAIRPNWLHDKLAKPIVQYGSEKAAELGDVPFAPDLIGSVEDKLLMDVGLAQLALGRPLVMPPDAPMERVTALRQALAGTFADKEFLAECARLGLGINAPRSGEQLADVIARAYHAPQRIIERLQRLNNS
jgi:tripartite-type tricarboxylate transporter receptor subunit TctC